MEEQKKREKGSDHIGETLFCPWCGKKIPEDSLYCEFCGGYVPEDEPDLLKAQEAGLIKEKREKATIFGGRGISRYWWYGMAALFLAVVALSMFDRGESKPDDTFFYIKDNSIYKRTADDKNEKPEEISAQYYEKWNSRSSGGLLKNPKGGENSGNVVPTYSVSGRYLFYLERGIKGSFDLVRKDLKKGESKTLDSDVVEFLPTKEVQVVYRKKNGALYCYEETKKTKLAEQAAFYRINEAGDTLLWETEEDGAKDIYLKSFLKKEDKVRLERNALFLDASTDFDVFLLQKADTVFKVKADGTKEKLMEGVSEIIQADASGETFYFLKEEGESPANAYLELYYYSGQKAELLEDSFGELIWQGEEGLIYTQTGDLKAYMLVSKNKSAELGMEVVLPERAAVSGTQLYFLSPDEQEGGTGPLKYELCTADLSESDFGRVGIVDTSVSELAGIFETQVYYYKASENGIGDLYCAGERVAYDVAVGSVAMPPSGSKVFCIADANGAVGRGTLTLIEGKQTEGLLDNVRAYSAVSDSSLYILSDYNGEKGRGNLFYYDGKNTRTLDSDIWGIFETGNSGECR